MSLPVDTTLMLQLLGLTVLFGAGMASFANPHKALHRLVFGAFSGALRQVSQAFAR